MQFERLVEDGPPCVMISFENNDQYIPNAYIDWNTYDKQWELSSHSGLTLMHLVQIARYMSKLEKPE